MKMYFIDFLWNESSYFVIGNFDDVILFLVVSIKGLQEILLFNIQRIKSQNTSNFLLLLLVIHNDIQICLEIPLIEAYISTARSFPIAAECIIAPR